MTGEKKADLGGVARLYTESLEKHGTGAMGVGWHDATSHKLRFEKLAEVIEPEGTSVSVNDLGCGYGAFYEYFLDHGVRLSHFRGYDISENMLGEARRRINAPNTEFVRAAKLDQGADYSFASGIFNVRMENDEGSWKKHVLTTLANMNEFSTRGFAFNLLTSYVDYREDHLFYGDPLFFFDHCKRRYSPQVVLLHDYPLWEWTILVRK